MSTITQTTVVFSCPKCGLNCQATQEHSSDQSSGSFDCKNCKTNVLKWSGVYDYSRSTQLQKELIAVRDRHMWRALFHIAFIGGAALMLAACGLADSHASLPGFLRVKESGPTPETPPPDVKRMVRENLNSVFVSTSNPRTVQVSPPHPNLRGRGWNACVRAELTNAVGKPLGTETYRIIIDDGVIFDRQRAEAEDNCVSESYEPIQ
jgi:hypothetical protein